MGFLSDMKQTSSNPPRRADTPTTPTPAPEGTESLAVGASEGETRREERREEQREVSRPVQLPRKQTCERCWQTPETWEESPCEYNDRVRVTCSVCGKFIGYRIHEWARKPEKGKRRKR